MSEETRGLTGNPAAAASSSSSSNSSGSNSNSGGNDGTNLENYLAEKKHFDRFISRIKFSNNKALMYKLLFLWIIGVVFSIAIMALLLNNDATYHLVNAYRQAFVEEELEFDDVQVPKQLWEIDNEQDFFAWLHGPFVGGISNINSNEQVYIYQFNLLLGAATLRQYRVKEGVNCKIPPNIAKLMGTELDANDEIVPSEECYPTYSESVHSEEPYGPGNIWTYEKTNAPLVRGPSDTSFGGNGFIIRLSYNPIVAAEQIAFIEENGWIDSQTRAVIITVNGFNPNLNKFTSAFIIMEFTAGGVTLMDANILPFRADYYLTNQDYSRLVLEILFWIWLFIQICIHVYVVLKEIKRKHNVFVWLTTPLWNLFGILSIVLYVISVIWYATLVSRNNSFINGIKDIKDSEYFIGLERLSKDTTYWTYFNAISIMIGILNIFRFLSFNRRFSIMWLTLSKAGLDLFVFIILFAMVCAAFVCAGNIIYGTHIYGFSRANLAIITTFLGMVDGLDFDELYTAQRICTPIYFILFTIIIVFILLNMFVAILTDAYSKIVEDENREEEEKRKEKGGESGLKSAIKAIKTKIYFVLYPDRREPSISSAQLLDLLKSTRRKIPEGKKLTRFELAEFTGFQDLSEPVFNELWAKLVTQKELNETELQPMGFGEANSEDEALEEHNAIKKEERDKLTSTKNSHDDSD